MSWGKGSSKGQSFKVLPANADSTVWIGGVPEGVTHEEIKANFEAAGTVKRAQLTGKGTGFVWFGSPQEAQSAITMFNGSVVNGSTMQVDKWTGTGKGSGGKSAGGGKWGGGKSAGKSSWGKSGGWSAPGAFSSLFQKFSSKGGKGKGKSKGFKVLESNVASTVWIGGIPEGLTFEEIKQNFSAAGTVKKVQLLGRSGQGLAWFSTPEEAASAITMFNGSVVNGSTLEVDVWTKKS